MELINQPTKALMEACKERARAAGLRFDRETIEYIVKNQDLLNLSPKIMIPTLYDYWVHGIEVNKGKTIYKYYPSNPYETVINTRPAVSFYNDNNPDWLNVMIFYHVLGHVDFFQNNLFFKETWSDDFMAIARVDRIIIDRIRRDLGEKKRFVDYVIEFTKALDNLVGYYSEMNEDDRPKIKNKADFFFGPFLKEKSNSQEWLKLSDQYDECIERHGEKEGEELFFYDMRIEFPELEALYQKYLDEEKNGKKRDTDIISFIMNNSPFLQKQENKWMKEVMEIVRRTSLYFQPQIRTKIMNEGWASYWHQELFESDPAMSTKEVLYSKVNAGVMSMPKVGLNPYALGYKLFTFIEELADKGKLSLEFERTLSIEERRKFDKKTGRGKDFIFHLRKNLNDFSFINFLSTENFQDFINKHNLFLADKFFSQERRSWIYYIKSKKAEDYRNMLKASLYHPPNIKFRTRESGALHIEHIFEDKILKRDWIEPVLRGVSFLWDGTVSLGTTDFMVDQDSMRAHQQDPSKKPNYQKVKMLYIVKDGEFKRSIRK